MGHEGARTSWQAGGPWAECRAGQTWPSGLRRPGGVAVATYISSLSAWLTASAPHCHESPHPGHPRWYNSSYGSYLSMSKLLGGAQYILTGSFGQHVVCKNAIYLLVPVGPWVMHTAGGSCHSWWVPMGTRICGYHSPAGTELAGGCNSRAPGTLFLLFIQTSHQVAWGWRLFLKYSALKACFESALMLAKLNRKIPFVFTGCGDLPGLFWRECTLLLGLESCYYKLIPQLLWAQCLSTHSDAGLWALEMLKESDEEIVHL